MAAPLFLPDILLACMDTLSDLIYETTHFTVERHPQPLVSREEGGHIRIYPKDRNISHLNDLSISQAKELIWLEAVVRLAILQGMTKQGVPMIWVNIEDLGNWFFKRNERPVLHIHVFGRAKTATIQKWPEALLLPDRSTGFYDGFDPLTAADMAAIRAEIIEVQKDDKYNPSHWA